MSAGMANRRSTGRPVAGLIETTSWWPEADVKTPIPCGAPCRLLPQYPFQVSPVPRKVICRAAAREMFPATGMVHDVVTSFDGFNRSKERSFESPDHERSLAPWPT